MPILDKPITEAEYYAKQYDKGKRARDKAAYEAYKKQQAQEIKPGQELYLEVTPKGVSKEVLTAPDVKAQTGITVNTREIFKPTTRVESYTESVSPSRSKVGQAYEDVRSGISNFLVSNVEAPIVKYYAGKKAPTPSTRKPFIDVKVPGGRGYVDFWRGAESYVIEKPTEVIGYAYGSAAAKYLITASPGISSAIGSTRGKLLTGGLLGIYGVKTAETVRASPNPAKALGEESVKFGAMLGGFGSAKFNPKSIANVKVKPVSRVEGFKTVSRNVEFNDLTIGSYYGKPLAFTGKAKTLGAGLFKVDNKFFRVTLKEKGFSRNIDSNKFMRSTATLDVQPYAYGLRGERIPTGRVSKARMTSEQVVFPSKQEGIFNVRGLSLINVKGTPRISRLVSAKATIKEDSSFIKGFNVDTFRGKAIKGSLKEVRGFTSTQLESPQESLTYSISKGYLFGRTPNKISVERSNLKSIPSFRREEFIKGSQESVYGMKSPSVQSSISEQSVKDVVSNVYRSNVAQQRFKFAKTFPKVISVQKSQSVMDVRAKESSRSLSSTQASRSSFALRSSPIVKSIPVSKSLLGVSSRSSVKPSLVLRQSPVSFMKQSPFIDSAIKSMTKTTTRQAQKVETKQVLRQTFSTRSINTFSFREAPIPFLALPSGSFKVAGLFGSSKGSSPKALFKESYSPSIEASFFNIRAKSTNVKLGGTGLVLRPILV